MGTIGRVLLAAVLLFSVSSVVHAEVYTYVDSQGRKYYSNVPISNQSSSQDKQKSPPSPSKPKTKPKVPSNFYATQILTLEKVEHPENPKERHGPKAEFLTPGKHFLTHEDNMIRIEWNNMVKSMEFVLNNKTDQSIKILWDESVYVDVDGVNHRIIHSGVKFNDRNSSQPPSVIIRKGKYNDALVPSDNIVWLKNSLKWHEEPLFPSWQKGGTMESFQKSVAPLTGKTFQILLALEIEGTPNDYIFSFKIDRVVTWQESERPK